MGKFISVIKAGTSDEFSIQVGHIAFVTEDLPVGGKKTSKIWLMPNGAVQSLQVYGGLQDTLKKIRSAK
jgi:hypothetical protein